jgi:YrbI family 3-deoxy-D-manno-octulosonate 8-phosphate phosphatase
MKFFQLSKSKELSSKIENNYIMNIALIPARCGSKSIEYKNIKSFCGKPLIYWNLVALQDSEKIDKIFVATDCNKIKKIVQDFDFSKVFIFDRSKKNSSDDATTESVIMEFLKISNFSNDDLFLLVQATSPLTTASDFNNAIMQLKNENADSLLTCVRSKRFFWSDDNLPINYDSNKRPRRQDFKGTLMENGAFYISSIANILKHNNRIGGRISIFEMSAYQGIELDEEEDWLFAENLMYKNKLNNKVFSNIKLVLSDVDGTLTDSGMYYSDDGKELKKFNTKDGKGFELLKSVGIKTGIITSEDTKIVLNRAKKLNIDYVFQGVSHSEKLIVAKMICEKENIGLHQVAYIGDDINCKELLESVGFAACPSDSAISIKNIPNIRVTPQRGGEGAVREIIDYILLNR